MTLTGYLKVTRPPLLILGVVASLGLLSWNGQLHTDPLRSVLIVCTVASANLGWTLRNEVSDIHIDRIKKPSRPLPSGDADYYTVAGFSFLILYISLGFNAWLGIFYHWAYFMGLLGHAGAWVYNCVRKDLVGNICMATTYGVAAFLSLYPHHLLFCIPWSLFTIAHNLNNQHQDWKADQEAGSYTVPQQLGAPKTFALSWGLLTVACVLFFHIFKNTGYYPLLFFMVVTVTTMVSSMSMLLHRRTAHYIVEYVARGLGRALLIIGFLAMLAV